jgi:hypothetical protein
MEEAILGEVYSVPGMERVFDAGAGNEAYGDTECRFDEGQQAVVFSLSSPLSSETDPKSKEVRFEIK